MHFIKNRKPTKRFLDLSYSFNISQDLSDQPLRDAHRGLAKIKGNKMLDPVIFHANRLVLKYIKFRYNINTIHGQFHPKNYGNLVWMGLRMANV